MVQWQHQPTLGPWTRRSAWGPGWGPMGRRPRAASLIACRSPKTMPSSLEVPTGGRLLPAKQHETAGRSRESLGITRFFGWGVALGWLINVNPPLLSQVWSHDVRLKRGRVFFCRVFFNDEKGTVPVETSPQTYYIKDIAGTLRNCISIFQVSPLCKPECLIFWAPPFLFADCSAPSIGISIGGFVLPTPNYRVDNRITTTMKMIMVIVAISVMMVIMLTKAIVDQQSLEMVNVIWWRCYATSSMAQLDAMDWSGDDDELTSIGNRWCLKQVFVMSLPL